MTAGCMENLVPLMQLETELECRPEQVIDKDFLLIDMEWYHMNDAEYSNIDPPKGGVCYVLHYDIIILHTNGFVL